MFIKLSFGVAEFLLSRRITRKLTWKYWYPFVTRRLVKSDMLFLNYTFVEEPENTPLLELEPEDEKHRSGIGLYHHLAQQLDLKGKKVLEVSCGHGGGASFILRYHHPRHLTAVDLNREGVRFCRERHPLPNLDFITANAERMPFASDAFDVVINVEASHAYGDFPAFVGEVQRVLKPGGHFLYADYRRQEDVDTWESELILEKFQPVHSREITAHVFRGMELNSERYKQIVYDAAPFFMRPFGKVFAGVEGTWAYRSMQNNDIVYRSYCLQSLS